MNKLSQWFRKIGISILTGIRRFPVAVGLSAVIMILVLTLVHQENVLTDTAEKWLIRIAMALGLGIPLSVAVQLFMERRDSRPAVLRLAAWAALAAFLALYLFLLLPDYDNAMHGMRYAAVLLASIALVPAVAYLPKRQGDERFALKLLLRLLITGIFTGILIGGIDLVLLMLEQLLEVKLWEHAYMDIAVISFGLFAPSFLLAGVPNGNDKLEHEPFQPLVRVLLGYIAFPLLAAYTAIIYAYFVRILILWSWPSNMLVNMVLWYTAIGVLAVYFMRTQNTDNRWFRLFDRWYPRLTVLPIVLVFIGILIRINAYGFTEQRFFVLVLAVWVTAATALAILHKPEKRANVMIPALLSVLAVLSVLGPWSAFGVSSASQNARLDAILQRNGMLDAGGKVLPKKGIEDKDKQQIYSILDYFDRVQGLGRVRALPPGTMAFDLPKVLGFDRADFPGLPNASYYISSGMPQTALDISGYDYLFISYTKSMGTTQGTLAMSVDEQSVFTITRDGKVIYSKDLKDYAKSFEGSYTQGRTYTIEELTFMDGNSDISVKFIINEAIMNMVGDSPVYSVPNFYALVKEK